MVNETSPVIGQRIVKSRATEWLPNRILVQEFSGRVSIYDQFL